MGTSAPVEVLENLVRYNLKFHFWYSEFSRLIYLQDEVNSREKLRLYLNSGNCPTIYITFVLMDSIALKDTDDFYKLVDLDLVQYLIPEKMEEFIDVVFAMTNTNPIEPIKTLLELFPELHTRLEGLKDGEYKKRLKKEGII